jgi:ABC-type uncharacterized transport system ATPase component
MVTHNMHHAMHYGDRLFVLADGMIPKQFTATEKSKLQLDDLLNWIL